jgi:hypothetical protein
MDAADPPDPRQQLKDELWSMGVSDDLAEGWIQRWEVEAARRAVSAGDTDYWAQALDWIVETRGD